MNIEDLNISLPDTHAMTDYTIYLQGQKRMLTDIIDYLIKAKP